MALILCPLQSAARRWGDAIAIDGHGQQLSYMQLDSRVTGLCNDLRKQGVNSGDHVGYCADNKVEAVVLMYACFRLNAVFIPLSTRFPAAQLQQLLEQLNIRFLYHDDAAINGITSLQLPQNDGEQLWRFDASVPATMVLTSGSSGQPKAAVHNLLQQMAAAEGSFDQTPLTVGDRWLLSLPLYHIGGMAILFRCLLSGATAVLPQHKAAEDCLAPQQISHVSMVATQAQRLLAKSDTSERVASLRVVLLGGGAIPAQLADLFATYSQLRALTSYGMTEMGSQITTGVANNQGLAGFPLAGRQIRINEDSDVIEVKGDCLFMGYYQRGQLQQPFDRDGWFATNDRGQWIGEQLKIIGRADNMFISGGENVQPEAIEAVISHCNGVKQVIVVPIDDSEFGQLPVAIVAGDYDQVALEKRLNKKLARFMRPRQFLRWPNNNDNTGIKVNRQAMMRYAQQQLAC
ncbi:o-succinylbenzoate--CoA ligase [uncultured Ferrimonas sp.]|uniref:o-succinylbenzoate--CoA ligase n=1 Tax=uncultured Ferrimonas sp. TaxID=432640 RepID=UPI002601A649|nr:o-succinylbenzoate--CoA ligase [uncultured Ferrimonas sp.]